MSPRVDLLEVPDDLVERKRNLLLGLELDDVGDLLFSTGGSLTKRARPLWPGTLMATQVALDLVARQELLERLAGQLVGVGVGLAEDLGMLDVVERGGDDLPVFHLPAESP